MKFKPILNFIALLVLSSGVCHALPNNRENYDLAAEEARRGKKVPGIYFDKRGSMPVSRSNGDYTISSS